VSWYCWFTSSQGSRRSLYYLREKITGFTTAEEVIAGKKSVVPFLNEELAKSHGAIWCKKRFYKDFAVQDGQLITGQNPFSVRSVAKMLIKEIK
jgi:putative intracellular protease/amidase